jgi:hypothetical protein
MLNHLDPSYATIKSIKFVSAKFTIVYWL